jgi:dihydropteroate synthase
MIFKCKDKLIEYGNKVLIMGIVNVTPDSFSDGGNWFSTENAVNHAIELVEQGADIIDFGAQSTRPGYEEISAEEEWSRLEGVLNAVKGKINVPISIDTYFPYVAEKALNNGADIVNDISGVITDEMAQIVKNTGCGWIIMHNGDGGCKEVKEFFDFAVNECDKYCIDKSQICLDMGIGFGKTYEQNLELIAKIPTYKNNSYPLLLGTSRKRVIGTSSGQSVASQRVYGNISADTVAILGGADIIRLHDVKNEKQGIMTAMELKRAGVVIG